MIFGLLRNWRRGKLFERQLPEPWREVLAERFSFLEELPEEELDHFEKHLKILLWEKDWFGAHGLEVTDEMKLVIGGSAARLARNLPLDVYDRVREIGVYPSGFRPPDDEAFHAAGMAHDFGTVLFSWDNVQRGIATPNDGYDTTLHEFAHMLDLNSGQFSGTPLLHNADDYHGWAEILSEHFEKLRDNPDRYDIVREYGATNEAEFFAVATEAFFEKPKTLKRRAPELYDQLRRYYRVDPLSRRPTIF